METSEARKWRWLILVSACVETFLFGGIVVGWGSLVFVLKQEGIFSHLCHDDTAANTTAAAETDVITGTSSDPYDVITAVTNHTVGATSRPADGVEMTSEGVVTCVRQDDMLSLCFTVTSAAQCVATTVAGAVSCRFGTRVCRLTGWVCFTLGGVFLAFTSPDSTWLMFGGLVLLGYGGIVLIITNIQIGMLFDKRSSTVIAFLCGLFDSSSVIMLFLKYAHESGFKRRDFLLVLCGLHVLTLAGTLVLMPRTHFTWTEEDHQETVTHTQGSDSMDTAQPLTDGGLDQTHDNNTGHHQQEEGEEEALQKTPEKDSRPEVGETGKEAGARRTRNLKECVLSTLFLMEVLWMALLQLRYTFFLTSFNPWLSATFPSSTQQVSYYTDVSLYAMMAGLPICLLSGALFDLCNHMFAAQAVARRRKLYPIVIMLGVTSTLGVLMSVCVVLDSPVYVFTACVLSAGLRSFLYSVDANIITLLFPPKYFTALFGVCDAVGGVVSFLQYAFVVWVDSAGFTLVNSVMLAVAVLSFVHPGVQLYRAARTDQSPDQGRGEEAALKEKDGQPVSMVMNPAAV